mmetsp:Transcript_19104/g.21624  ORF Transcript_19104/g.21624 Transcript_19104/m.21624 type:complete len:139 (+) Transcript_19104:1-417(+)
MKSWNDKQRQKNFRRFLSNFTYVDERFLDSDTTIVEMQGGRDAYSTMLTENSHNSDTSNSDTESEDLSSKTEKFPARRDQLIDVKRAYMILTKQKLKYDTISDYVGKFIVPNQNELIKAINDYRKQIQTLKKKTPVLG